MSSSRSREAGGELPYTGAIGSTRYEAVFVTGSDGVSRRVEIVRSVNVASDPALKAPALDGSLHRTDGGSYLAVPFVYHDPGARKFALVVPASRAHEELAQRAQLITALANEVGSPLPSYVREARVVVGTEGLQRYLVETVGGDARAAAEAEAKVEAKIGAVAQREERLRERAEDVTRREDELRERLEEFVERENELKTAAAQLERRLAELQSREEAIADEERALLANKSALQSRERLLDAREAAIAERERELSSRESEFVVARAEHEIESVAARPSHAEPIEPMEADSIEAAVQEAVESAEADAEAIEAATPLPGPLPTADREKSAEEPAAEEALEAEEAEEIAAEEIEPEPTSSRVPAAWAARGYDAYAAVVDGEVRVWARGGPQLAARLARGETPLVLQLDPESKLPLALLSVVARPEGERLARLVLDSTRPDDRAVLETLGRDFRVRLEVVSQGGRSVGSYAVADQCEANAQRALDVLSTRDPSTEDARRAETERLLRDGVVSAEGDAFEKVYADEAALGTVEGVDRAVAAYAPLMDRAVFDRFVLSRGVPASRIDGFGKRVIFAALRCGVVLPAPLVARALESGVAASEKALAVRALTTFARTCESGLDAIGRSRSDASHAWAGLLSWAERAGAEITDPVRAAVRALFDPDDPEAVLPPDVRPSPSASAITAMSDEELLRWVDHPAVREQIADAMVSRDATKFGESLARAVRLLAPEIAARVAGKMTAAGDALGDVWVELLASRRNHARVLAATAVAVIRLRRGLNPLLQRAMTRDEGEWPAFAWAAGEFGTAAVRAASRIEEGDPERLGWVLAHAVRSGAGRDVEKSRASSNPLMAEAATRAVGRVDEARALDAALRHNGGTTEGQRWVSAMLANVESHASRAEDDAANS
jgi:hypothetical protein